MRSKQLCLYTALLGILLLTSKWMLNQSTPTTLEAEATQPTKAVEKIAEPQPRNDLPLIEDVTADAPETPTSGTHDFASLRKELSRDTDAVTVIEHDDGTTEINLNGTFRTASIARRQPDGSFETACFENYHAAEEFLTNPQAQRPAAHDHSQGTLSLSLIEK